MTGIDFAAYVTPELAANMERREAVTPKVIHRAATRGYLNEGWLQSYQTFNYTGHHNPERVCFGKLRVLNEDTIAPGAGLPYHRASNMEIVYIPLEGAMQHYDTMGNSSVIRKDEILVVSAGSGIMHSAYNANRDHVLRFLQVWFYPEAKDSEPGHRKFKTDPESMHNNLAEIVAPDGTGNRACVNQRAWLSMGRLEKDFEFRYRLHSKHNGAYIFIIKGEATVNGEKMRSQDGMGLWHSRCIDIRADTMAQVLVVEVPMN